MPKPAKVEANVRDWLRNERGDTLDAFTRVITISVVNPGTEVSGSVSVADLRLPARALGRDLSDMWGVPGHARAFAVSPSTFRVLHLSGWKERVKEVEAEAPIGEVTVHHLDDTSQSGHGIRYFVIDLPDGRWMVDSQVVVKKNGERGPFAASSDALIEALGTRAVPIG
ncbi:MAG: hypothetical protein RIE08_06870 [Acidimicrobiales bacterium]